KENRVVPRPACPRKQVRRRTDGDGSSTADADALQLTAVEISDRFPVGGEEGIRQRIPISSSEKTGLQGAHRSEIQSLCRVVNEVTAIGRYRHHRMTGFSENLVVRHTDVKSTHGPRRYRRPKDPRREGDQKPTNH